MLIAVNAYVTSGLSAQESVPQGIEFPGNFCRTVYLFFLIAWLGLLLGSGGCTGVNPRSETSLPPSAELEKYLQTASHLNEKQKEQMALHRPFVGMTIDEANLAMRQESAKLILSGKAMQAVYVGGSGVRYQLYFQGDPPSVVNWTSVSDDQIELTDPNLLRPTPPVGHF